MKKAPALQFYALVGALALHMLAFAWLNRPAARAPVTPPRVASMQMVSVAAPQPAAAAPQPAPQKAAPKAATPRMAPSRPTPTPQPAPVAVARADSAAISQSVPQPAAAPSAPAGKSEGEAKEVKLAITEPLSRGGYLNNPKPTYPTLSIEEGEAGTVRLRVHVSAQGAPLEVSLAVSSGFPRLDRAALASVKQWRFIPAKRGEEPIPYTFIVPVEFSLKSART